MVRTHDTNSENYAGLLDTNITLYKDILIQD